MKYRPEIDGLRAIAVIAVVLFHAGIGFPGGYIGVDVFFVISGYLITTLILRELQEGRFSLVNFWERRIRRIVPAAVVVVVAVLIMGWFLLLPSDYATLGRSAAWQSVFGANFFFWLNTGYFSGPAEEMPLLHTWSLAVEEQFYLLFPLVLALLFRWTFFRRCEVLFGFLGFGLVLSLILSIYTVNQSPKGTFYLLPTRAWELLSGSVIAALPTSSLPKSRQLRSFFSWLGIGAIAFPCFVYDKYTLFPGLAALPPCLGTCLILLATNTRVCGLSTLPMPLVGRILSLRPVVFVGLISYSFYLWHWPLFAFSNYWEIESLLVTEKIRLAFRFVIVGVSMLLAILTWRFVESPFRKRQMGVTRPSMFFWGIAGLVLLVTVGLIINQQHGFPSRFSERVYTYDRIGTQDRREGLICPPVELEGDGISPIPSFGKSSSLKSKMIVWGDSHARSILPAVIKAAESKDNVVYAAWHSSSPPAMEYICHPRHKASLGSKVPDWADAILQEVKTQGIKKVLLAARWSEYFSDHNLRRKTKGVTPLVGIGEALLETVRRLREYDAEVWILREVPSHTIPVPKALTLAEVFGVDPVRFACDRKGLIDLNTSLDALESDIIKEGGRLLDLSNLLIADDGEHYRMEYDGIALYYDEHHLTQEGSRMLAPAFASIFQD